MSDYSKITNFLAKDSLALNDPAKYVKGSELDAEFNAIATAVASKVDESTNVREKLLANRTYYVRTDGSDSNTGLANTAGAAFLTIQKAINVISTDLDLNEYIASVQVADGTYTAGATVNSAWTGGGDVYILGNLTTPANCIINTTSVDCFVATKGATLLASGFKITTTTSGCAAKASLGAYLALGAMNYGACAEAHIECGTGATIVLGSNYTISGNAVSHLHCGAPGTILAGTITVTLTGTPAFSAYFAGVAEGTITVSNVTWSGAATGLRFLAHKNGIIDVGAGTITTLPGDVAGYADVGGTYACTTGVQDAEYLGGPSTAPAVKVVPVVDQDRHITLTGADSSSGSPNPAIGVSGGNLEINAAIVGSGTVQALDTTATPVGGAVAFYMGSDAVGIYWGSGAPSATAARGSLYIRIDNGANTSLYVNRDGSTTWAAVTSA